MIDEALNRYTTAKGYVEAAKMIFTSRYYTGERMVMTILPMHLLTGFALELFFKAWLLQAGMPSGEVRGFGHKIEELFQAATDKGLPSVPSLDRLVALFDGPHSDFTYRYIDAGTNIDTAAWPKVFPLLDQLDTVVDTYIGASANKGLAPGH